jgi:two-component system response regulator AlgR
MKILLVDDEALARARMRQLLEGLGDCTVCAEAASGEAALQAVNRQQPDVLLLDIRMPGMDGLEVARHLQALDEPPAIIFTTAYNDYALQAFETHAVDYLLKPVRSERLAEALAHARRLTRAQAVALQDADQLAAVREHICANVRGSLQLIAVEEIRYFLADQKYVTVCSAGDSVLIEDSLKSLEQEFGERFVRIHRNALVAPRYLAGLERDADGRSLVILQGVTERLEVSRRHLAAVRDLVRKL